jgi:hypothetical protein
MAAQALEALRTFLSKNVEGYLFEDLKTLKDIQLPAGKAYGAAGYPLLQTAFAGIELLGSLVSNQAFNTHKGHERFREFWEEYLYPTDAARKAAGDTLYQLARHGLAHAFVVKGNLTVVKNDATRHLTMVDADLYVDAVALAEDLIATYEFKIRPSVQAGDRLATTMLTRLGEIGTAYQGQAGSLMGKLSLPIFAHPGGQTPIGTTNPSSSSAFRRA